MTDRAGLAGEAAAGHIHQHVEIAHIGQHQGLTHGHLQGLQTKVAVNVTLVDDDFAIAHNKIMILDDETVITGSFNFTKAAEERNAENVLVIRGNKDLAKFYLQNWQWRWDASEAYKRKE